MQVGEGEGGGACRGGAGLRVAVGGTQRLLYIVLFIVTTCSWLSLSTRKVE